MRTITLELTVEQYAGVREGLAFLSKTMALRPDVKEDAVLTRAEISGLLEAMEEQVSQIELVKMLIEEARILRERRDEIGEDEL